MEISGINRLLAIAEELGVRETKSVGRLSDSTRETADHDRGRTVKSRDDDSQGFRVSLSAEASRIADQLDAPKPPVPSETPSTSQLASDRAEPREGTEPSSFRRNRAVAAYQKNASASIGDRIRVIA